MEGVYFPVEILTEILLHQPVPSLLRFTGVSKTLLDEIRHPDFVHKHHSKTRHRNKASVFLIRRPHDQEKCYELLLTNDSDDYQGTNHHPDYYNDLSLRVLSRPNPLGPQLHLYGSCNGFLCLSRSTKGGPFYLYNPITLEHQRLPDSKCLFRGALGFGFDVLTKDYKVIRLGFLGNGYPVAVIYKLSTHSWAMVDPKLEHIEVLGSSVIDEPDRNAPVRSILREMLKDGLAPAGGVFVNGCCHWIGEYMGRNYILRFDFHTEVFGLTKFPYSREDAGFQGLNRTLSVLSDSLSLITEDNMRESFEVWVMLQQ